MIVTSPRRTLIRSGVPLAPSIALARTRTVYQPRTGIICVVFGYLNTPNDRAAPAINIRSLSRQRAPG